MINVVALWGFLVFSYRVYFWFVVAVCVHTFFAAGKLFVNKQWKLFG